jgi:hypothetical protein
LPPLIKDYLEFRKVDYQPTIETANLADCLRTFVPTDGLVELMSRVLEAVLRKLGGQQASSQEPTSILLTGGHGVGKSHLLAVIYSLVSQTGTLTSGLQDPRIQSHVATLRDLSPLTIWIDLSEGTETPLPELVLKKIQNEFQVRFHKQVVDLAAIPGIDTVKAHELITFNIALERPILLIIDSLSKRALKRDVQQLNEDIEFLSFIGYSSKATRLFLLVAAHEDFFSPKSPLGIDSALMAQTLENFRIEWIDRANLREIITRRVLKKNPRQYQDLKKLYSFIKAKLPHFQYSENEFCDAYPFHPLVFDLSERIKSKLPAFSLLDFVISTYPKIASHRAISLVTIDSLFDRLEYDIRNNPQCKRLYTVYQNLAEQAVLRLEDRWKLWGKMLLKASFLFTLADRAPSVRDLTDSLMLYEDSDTGLSYNVVGMLMGRMEKAVEHGFSSTEERLDRTYRLGIADLREELNKYLSNIAAQIPDSDPRTSEILLSAAEKHFPDWPIRSELPRSVAATHTRLQKINWRGTERQGLLLHSERVRGPKHHALSDSEEDAAISQKLPNFQEPFPTDEAAASSRQDLTGARGASGEIEWILWMEPIGLMEEEESKIKPQRPTEVHWLPSSPSGKQLTQIKRILARHLTEKSHSSDFAASDLHSLREEHNLDVANLFRELYLSRGKIITTSQTQAFNQQHLECHTFQSFANYLLKPNLDQLYSLHPDFGGEQLSENHVMTLTRKLFAGQDPTDDAVQKLAGRFALPLGLVSRSDDLYELNLDITPPIFLTQVTQFLENLDASERPVDSILEVIHRPPFGLTRSSLHLILAALVADGRIELLDPQTNTVISRENLAAIENLPAFSIFKRIQTHKDYPSEVLTHWCHLITGKQELADISTSRGRNAATAALKEWLQHWRNLDVSRKLDSLPNELLTTQMWRKLAWTKRRFEKVAEVIETFIENKVSLIQGMAKIIELFGENVGSLEKTSRDLVELSHFIHWLENFMKARDYILSSEKTESPEIEKERESLRRILEAPHELVASEKRNEFEGLFLSFKEHFIDYYAPRHDQSVGPLGNFKLLEELESSQDFRNLQLLMSLPLGDSSYVEYLDEWIASFRDHRCSLPVRDLLQHAPACECKFKLCRPLEMVRVVEDLRAFLDLGISHHKQMITYYQHIIEPNLNSQNEGEIQNAETLRSLLGQGPLPELTQAVIDQINSFVDTHISEEKLTSPLAVIAPTGRITKKQLQARIQQWLDSLSAQEDVLFSLKDF